MRTNPDPGDIVKSDETLLEMIEALQELNGATVGELVAHTGFSKSTVYRHLATLEKHEYVIRRFHEYNLSLQFLSIGNYVRHRNEIHEEIKPQVRKIAEQTKEIANFIVEEHGVGVFVFRRKGANGVSTNARVGMRTGLHHTAAGKAILASLPEDDVHDIIERRGLPAKTENTITEPAKLFEELETIRNQRYSIDREETIEGLCAVGVPMVDPNGEVLGGFSVAGPTYRLKGNRLQEKLPNILLSLTNELELNITYS